MRVGLYLLTVVFLQSAFAGQAPGKTDQPTPPQYTQVIDHLSNPAIENIVALSDQLTSQADMGTCDHFVYRVQMHLPPDINYDVGLNEFMSMVSPEGRAFIFGILGIEQVSDNGILKMVDTNVSDKTQTLLGQLNTQVNSILSADSANALMGGTAVYSKQGMPDVQMSVRAVVDTNASQFLMFGVGRCQ